MIKTFLAIIIAFLALNINAQEYSTKSRKAIKLFEKARSEFNNYNDLVAQEYLNAALKKDPDFIEAYILYAEIYYEKKDIEKQKFYYSKAISIDSSYSYRIYYHLAKLQLRSGEYKKALNNFNKVLSFSNVNNKTKAFTKELLKRTKYALELKNNPVEHKPVRLSDKINTRYNDYWPSLTIDEKVLVTTVLLPKDDRFPVNYKNSQEDIFISYKVDDEWTEIRKVEGGINTGGNEGSQNISPDGRFLFYTICNRKGDYGKCDLYFAKRKAEEWTELKNIGPPVSTSKWESNPSFSSDGKTLYFTSESRNQKGQGRKDIWKSILQKDGSWTEPENLGKKINSDGNEVSPFIHPNNKTLYFSSDGHKGMGGMDVFKSVLDSNGNWSEPVNLGYPINTFGDEVGLIVNASGNIAMYASKKNEETGMDIYKFELPEKHKTTPVFYVKGYVYDSETKKKLSTKFKLIDLKSDNEVVKSVSDEITGKYIVTLPGKSIYAFNASKPGYLFYSENFKIDGSEKFFNMNIPLQPIKEGMTVELKNIFYDTDKYSLKEESKTELEILIKFLEENQNIKIEIGGHTDNVGSLKHNQELSENRAKNVYEYLIKNGISENRLSYRGYNFSVQKYSNDNETGRAKNRRTEFKIVEVK